MLRNLHLVTSIFLAGLCVNPSPLRATPEDDARASLLPFLDALASPPSGPNRAFQLKGHVESLAGHPVPEAVASFELCFESPDRLRIQFPFETTSVIACRNRQTFWAAPKAHVASLLQDLPPSKSQPPAELPSLQIPFPGKQIEFFLALLQITPKGQASLGTLPCTVVDLRILPQLARILPPESDAWAARLWFSPDKAPTRLGIQRPGASAVFRFDSVQFARALPPETWLPGPEAAPLPASQLEPLLLRFARTITPAASPTPPSLPQTQRTPTLSP